MVVVPGLIIKFIIEFSLDSARGRWVTTRPLDVLDILDIFYKSLKPNSVLIIQTPNAESPFGSRYRYYDLTHGLSFTTSSLNQALKTAGFKEMTFYPMGPVVHGLKSLIRYILWKIIVLIIKFYLVVETGSSKGIFTQNLIAVAKK